MNTFKPILKRELYAYFLSPLAYVVLGTFFLLCGYFFSRSISYFSYLSLQAGYDHTLQTYVNSHELIVRPFFSSIMLILICLIPLLTMRTFAEERKRGTLELLMSYPADDTFIVLAKNASCFLVVAAGLLGSALFLCMLFLLTRLEIGPIFTGYVGLVLLSWCLVAIGILLSVCTDNQTLTSILTFAAFLMLWSVAWFADFVPGVSHLVLKELSIQTHFESFGKGVISSRDIMYFIGVSIFANFMSVTILKQMIRCR